MNKIVVLNDDDHVEALGQLEGLIDILGYTKRGDEYLYKGQMTSGFDDLGIWKITMERIG